MAIPTLTSQARAVAWPYESLSGVPIYSGVSALWRFAVFEPHSVRSLSGWRGGFGAVFESVLTAVASAAEPHDVERPGVVCVVAVRDAAGTAVLTALRADDALASDGATQGKASAVL